MRSANVLRFHRLPLTEQIIPCHCRRQDATKRRADAVQCLCCDESKRWPRDGTVTLGCTLYSNYSLLLPDLVGRTILRYTI